MKQVLVGGLIAGLVTLAIFRTQFDHDVVLGAAADTTATALPGPTVVVPPPATPPPDAPPAATRPAAVRPGLKGADGRPWGSALVFRSSIPVPSDLVFVLVAGADARPHEDVRRTRADSIHLLAVNPRTLNASIVGIPRDAWVEVPGHGTQKINQALPLGGPQLLADTVRHLTGLPVHFYVLTGFRGFAAMVDELGGVDIHVDYAMNDRNSGARFARGWHHFNGAQALAFARNRHGTPDGDFSRSENHGRVILAALAKARAEIDGDSGIDRWLRVLLRHADVDAGLDDVRALASLARRLEPNAVANVVVPGHTGTARGGQSVVYLGQEAADIFLDLRPDAAIGS